MVYQILSILNSLQYLSDTDIIHTLLAIAACALFQSTCDVSEGTRLSLLKMLKQCVLQVQWWLCILLISPGYVLTASTRDHRPCREQALRVGLKGSHQPMIEVRWRQPLPPCWALRWAGSEGCPLEFTRNSGPGAHSPTYSKSSLCCLSSPH